MCLSTLRRYFCFSPLLLAQEPALIQVQVNLVNVPSLCETEVDSAGSQEQFLKDHRRDLRDFLKTMMTKRDQAMLACFGNSIRLVSAFIKQADQLDEAMKDFQKAKNVGQFLKLGPPELRSGGTAFYDAVCHSSREMVGQDGRRAMLLFSDGEDNSSANNLMDTAEAAQETGVTIFTLRYTEIKKGVWTARNKYGRCDGPIIYRIGRA